MTDDKAAPALEALRRELDAIDSGLLALLAKRFSVSDQVKSFKQVTAKAALSPLRPAREAQIHRRILDAAAAQGVPAALALKIWRAILSESSLRQTPITLHVSRRLSSTVGNRLRLRDHFPGMTVEEWKDEATVLAQVDSTPADIAAIEVDSQWIDAFIQGRAGNAQVIGVLPTSKEAEHPDMLIIGHAPQEQTGSDETLLITQGNLPRDFPVQPVWQIKSGPWRLSALGGFYSDQESPLVGLTRSNVSLGLKLAGRYPSAIEV
jgi:chorismate mutase